MKFEDFKMETSETIIATFYHWSDGEYPTLSLKNIHKNKVFYVCDNMHDWCSPHLNTYRLYEVDCAFRNPLVLLEQWEPYENINWERKGNKKFLLGGKFDSIIYTPHPYSQATARQAVLLFPHEQVIGVREIKDFDLKKLKVIRDTNPDNFQRMLKKK